MQRIESEIKQTLHIESIQGVPRLADANFSTYVPPILEPLALKDLEDDTPDSDFPVNSPGDISPRRKKKKSSNGRSQSNRHNCSTTKIIDSSVRRSEGTSSRIKKKKSSSRNYSSRHSFSTRRIMDSQKSRNSIPTNATLQSENGSKYSIKPREHIQKNEEIGEAFVLCSSTLLNYINQKSLCNLVLFGLFLLKTIA
ncbi:uncharacterized protein LOC117169708 [Belonocnema kinseyi]|uniref:uncharacterized protein LOC117169708 n=1 Tax=Belonocnema kinseyi TaxID=2817044 RepID=UPI00143D780E|nr:uncharacterized protein LOC117169708 [Belonocnema kinseyi]